MKRSLWATQHPNVWVQFACAACWVLAFGVGCRSSVPIYVWQPAPFTCPHQARIAIAPVAGEEKIAARVETALMMERPQARADLQLIGSQQLLQQSPIRLVSTAALQNDATVFSRCHPPNTRSEGPGWCHPRNLLASTHRVQVVPPHSLDCGAIDVVETWLVPRTHYAHPPNTRWHSVGATH